MSINVKQYLSKCYPEEEIMIFDGLDEAFIGVGFVFNKPLACYDKDKIITTLTKKGMSDEDAEEYFQFNIAGAYVGENTPVIVETPMMNSE